MVVVVVEVVEVVVVLVATVEVIVVVVVVVEVVVVVVVVEQYFSPDTQETFGVQLMLIRKHTSLF